VDLLTSGPQRPRRVARAWWRRRSARVGAGVVAAAAVLALVLVTANRPDARLDPAAAAATPAAPSPQLTFDRLPGRTPIPEPAQTGDRLSGPLPAIGGPSRTAAARAAGMVLGRYCADLTRFTVELHPYEDGRTEDFRHLDALVTDRLFTDSGPAMQLTLDWDGQAYRWFGPLTLLAGC
jgi:hypothetical protein